MCAKKLEKPKYEIIGDLERLDPADIVMERRRLVPDSAAWHEYYQRHPELEESGRRWVDLQKSRKNRLRIAPEDELMETAMRYVPDILAKIEHVEGKPSPEKIVINPHRASEKIKGFARYLGADLVKIGPFNPAWSYQYVESRFSGDGPRIPIDLTHANAVVVAIAYRRADIECAPRMVVGLATQVIYQRLSTMVVTLARYIRSLGYAARAHNHNSQLLQVPVAVDAGLGELARNGIFISEKYGSAIKPMVVTTDMPLELDKPVDIGVAEFCSQCQICGEFCPSGAITRGSQKVVRGVLKWALNGSACYDYFLRSGANCSLCITYCPWTRPRTFPHNIILKAVERSKVARTIAIKADQLLRREKKGKIPHWLEQQPETWREVLRSNHPLYHRQ